MAVSHPGYPLATHLEEIGNSSKNIIEQKKLNLNLFDKGDIALTAYVMGISHDFGKFTGYFQDMIEKGGDSNLSHHAPISAIFTYTVLEKLFPHSFYLPLVGYLGIRYHHGNLQNPAAPFKLEKDLKKQWDSINQSNFQEVKDTYNNLLPSNIEAEQLLKDFEKQIEGAEIKKWHKSFFHQIDKYSKEKSPQDLIEIFLVCNLLFSALIDSDKKYAGNLDQTYFKGANSLKLGVEEYLNHLKKSFPEDFNPEQSINQHRNTFFYDVSKKEKLKQGNVFTLTAPTGIGKTFGAFGAISSLEQVKQQDKKLIYCLPFTSIIDQNYEELEKLLGWQLQQESVPTRYLFKHHYLASKGIEREGNKNDSEQSKNYAQYYDDCLLNESWDSGNVVTTFVQLFESILGNKNRNLKKFHNIINANILLDEIQNIPGKYHQVIGQVLQVMAERFDTPVTLMSATQPHIFPKEVVKEISQPDHYFSIPELNRVHVQNFDNLSPVTIDNFADNLEVKCFTQSTLIVCNTKKSAFQLFEKLRQKVPESARCFYLTTYMTPVDRRQTIAEIQNLVDKKEPVLCVSTQLIEAGVNLSFPVVYRDLGPFDSIVQVAGRCNRNGEFEKGQMCVMNLVNDNSKPFSNFIYDQKLLQYTSDILNEWQQFESKDFYRMGDQYFQKFDFKKDSMELLQGLFKLNYDQEKEGREKAISEFKLIDDQNFQEDIIVCQNEEVENAIKRLDEIRDSFKIQNLDQKTRKELLGKSLLIKQELANYTISVNKTELEGYWHSTDLEEAMGGKMQYIPYSSYNQGEVYNTKTGFNPFGNTNNKTVSI